MTGIVLSATAQERCTHAPTVGVFSMLNARMKEQTISLTSVLCVK